MPAPGSGGQGLELGRHLKLSRNFCHAPHYGSF
jgi:hypothetical protein